MSGPQRTFFVVCIVAILAFAEAPSAAAQVSPLKERLDALAKRWLDESRVPALSFAVYQDGALLHQSAVGVIDLEHEVPAQPNAWFRVGAITMAMTAVAVLSLVEDGDLKLETSLGELISETPGDWPEITLRELLQHTSGIGNYTSLRAFRDRMREDHAEEEVLRLIFGAPREFEPRTKWAFNPSNYYLLGVILERVTGQRYEKVLQEHALGPAAAGLAYDDQRRILRGRARGYEVIQGRRRHADFVSMDAPFAAAGLIARAPALAQWMDALARGALLAPEQLQALTAKIALTDGTPVDYGMGLALGQLASGPIWAHQGFVAGFSAHLQYHPDAKLSIAVLANSSTQLIGRIAGEIAAECLGLAPAGEAPKRFDRIVGRYRIRSAEGRDEDAIEVREVEGRLELVLPVLGAVRMIAIDAWRFEDADARGITLEVPAEQDDGSRLLIDMGDGPREAFRQPK